MLPQEIARHIPVLSDSPNDVQSVLTILDPGPGETVLDATVGLGGHAEEFLRLIGPTGRLIGLDADSDNATLATENLKHWAPQVVIRHMNFRDILTLAELPVDILFADLGVSSPHFDDPSRGFSFRHSSPLDMRFDRTRGETASDFLRTAKEESIYRTLAHYGELRGSARLASALFSAFNGRKEIVTTDDLKAAVEKQFGFRAPSVLPQVFQALRIHVNDELGALRELLVAIPHALKPGGRAGIISFHSLEDRMVKTVFRSLTSASKDPQTGAVTKNPPFELLTKKALMPGEEEMQANPRSRSARFRVIRRIPD